MVASPNALPGPYDLICNAFANSSVGVSIRAAGDRSLYVNPALESLFGYSRAELRSHRFADLYHPDDQNRCRALYGRILSGELESYSNTLRIIRKGGESVWVINELSALRDDRGEIVHTVSLFHDISALKAAEAETSRKTSLLQVTLDTMATAFAVFSADMRLVQHNAMFEHLFGYPAGFLYPGIPLSELIRFRATRGDYGPGQVDAIVARRVAEATRDDERTGEHRLATGKIYIHHRKSLPGGGCVTTYTEVTAQRAAEERLRQSQKMEAIGQLTGGIAHDFNNLLAVMLGNLELLRDELAPDSDARQTIETIYSAGRRGAHLTQQLLSFSRKQSLRPHPIDLTTHIHDLAGLLRRILGENVEVVIAPSRRGIICRIDAGQFDAALINLCINARDAMPEGGTLTLAAELTDLSKAQLPDEDSIAPGTYAALSVADTGCGMNADVRAHATEPFFTTKDVGQGSGLGLSMVYGFVRQSGGFMNIDSAEGRGTSVTLYLPVTDEAVASDDISAPLAPGTSAKASHKPLVLVVEDDPDVREVAVAMIEHSGYRTVAAPSGIKALDLLRTGETPDLLFTDIVLPHGINGIELAKQARILLPRLKVLFTSGYPDRSHPITAGANENLDILAKPYMRATLTARLDALLRSKS